MSLPIYNNPIINLANQEEIELDKDIILYTDIERFKIFLSKFKKTLKFALDIETTSYKFKTDGSIDLVTCGGLDPFLNDIRLIQVAIPTGSHLECDSILVIDLGGVTKSYPSREEAALLKEFWKIFKERLANPEVEVLGHNLKFDLTTLQVKLQGKLLFSSLRDTMLLSQIMWSGVGITKVGKSESRKERGIKGFHSLKLLAQRVLDLEVDKTEQTSDWAVPILSSSQINYAAKDVRILFPIYHKLKQLVIDAKLAYSVYAELLALPAFIQMEYTGYFIDKETLLDNLEKYERESEKCVKIWHQYAPESLPIQKTDKDIVPFFKKLGIEIEKCAKQDLAYLNHPAGNALLEYRSLKKSIDYLKSVLKKVETSEGYQLGCRIRTRFTQIATNWRTASSGKLSGTNFTNGKKATVDAPLAMNLQQIPNLSSSQKEKGLPNIRNMFTVPKGYKLIIADLSQAHSRIAAQMFKDKTQLGIYNEGKDGHLLMATKLLEAEGIKLKFEEVLKIYKEAKHKEGELTELENKIIYKRQEGKTGFYSFLNQAGAATMQQSFKAYGMDVDLEYCETLKKALREVYSGLYLGIKEYMKKVNSGALINFEKYKDLEGNSIKGDYGVIYGAECKLYAGNRSRNFCLRTKGSYSYEDTQTGKTVKVPTYDVAFTDSISFMWLSTEATIMKVSLGELYQEFNKEENKKWCATLVNFVHDQLDVEVKEEYAEEVALLVRNVIKKNMENFIDCIPVEEDGTDHRKWIGDRMTDLH